MKLISRTDVAPVEDIQQQGRESEMASLQPHSGSSKLFVARPLTHHPKIVDNSINIRYYL